MHVSGDDVRRQLDRLLASPGFANAGRMSRFLKFVVEQTLAGEGERLKEYVIGVEVFDRDADYDPRVDAIVRVEAARLRTKLAEYYAGEGRGDPVVLSLPKGGYAPAIKREPAAATDGAGNGAATNVGAAGPTVTNGAATPAATTPPAVPQLQTAAARGRVRAWLVTAALAGAVTLAVATWAPWSALEPRTAKPRVAVLPFTPYPDGAGPEAEAAAMRITEGVTAELVRSGRFGVVASSAASAAAAAATRPRDLAATLEADLLIEARLTLDGERVHVEARAAGANEQKLWVENFVGNAADSDALEREIGAAIAAALGNAETTANR
jgi:TolB-like protein